ncbi:MAG: hypothetical protein VKJ02_07080, partial [Snowella sp.]|nr:hypothetical protein [Snowella sp.]
AFAIPLSWLNGCLSFLLMVKYLSFQKFTSMAFLHNWFRIAIDFNDRDTSLFEVQSSVYDQKIQGKINNIKKYSNKDSKFYGKLVNWHSGGFWHYGIGLSDEYIFDLGENLDIFYKKDREIKFVQKIRHFPPDKTIQRLIHALCCFKDWHYGFLGWNCEHYSRLVATNVAISYQVKKSPLAFLNHGGYHPTAVQKFTDYLNHLGLSELTMFDH